MKRTKTKTQWEILNEDKNVTQVQAPGEILVEIHAPVPDVARDGDDADRMAWAKGRETAQQIVRAMNAFDDLVAVCEEWTARGPGQGAERGIK